MAKEACEIKNGRCLFGMLVMGMCVEGVVAGKWGWRVLERCTETTFHVVFCGGELP